MLFQVEASGSSADEAIDLYWRSFASDADPEGRAYADDAVRGVAAARDELDQHITKASAQVAAATRDKAAERMSRVDRNVLRLGAWELAHRPDVPRAVALDEAVVLAKSYGTDDSGAFVNGVLNKIAETLGRVDARPGT